MRIILPLALTSGILVACQESFDQRLQREAREFTQNNCPQEPEPGSRLDSTTYDPQSRTFTSWYSLSAENEEVVKANGPLLRRKLLEELIADVNYKAVKDEKVTFRYVYRSQARTSLIYETRLTASDYAR